MSSAKPDIVLQVALDAIIDQRLREEDERDREVHQQARRWPKQRLSAGRLGWPLQWQVLHALGAPAKPIDGYTRRKFKRGRDVEEWFVNCLTIPHERQVPLEYQQVVGYADVVAHVDERKAPWEVKSVKSSKFAHLKKQGPDLAHCLQGCCYALALGAEAFTVLYIVADDLRILPFTLPTRQFQEAVELKAQAFTAWMEESQGQMIPEFQPNAAWQSKSSYNSYPEWAGLEPDELQAKYEQESPSWE